MGGCRAAMQWLLVAGRLAHDRVDLGHVGRLRAQRGHGHGTSDVGTKEECRHRRVEALAWCCCRGAGGGVVLASTQA
jgi:hypothetical protein